MIIWGLWGIHHANISNILETSLVWFTIILGHKVLKIHSLLKAFSNAERVTQLKTMNWFCQWHFSLDIAKAVYQWEMNETNMTQDINMGKNINLICWHALTHYKQVTSIQYLERLFCFYWVPIHNQKSKTEMNLNEYWNYNLFQ